MKQSFINNKSQFQVVTKSELSSKVKEKFEEDNPKSKVDMNALKVSVNHMNKTFDYIFEKLFDNLLDQYSKIENSFKVEIKEKMKAKQDNPFEDPLDISSVEKNLLNLKKLIQKSKLLHFRKQLSHWLTYSNHFCSERQSWWED